LGDQSPAHVHGAAEPSINPDNVRTDMYFYLAENEQHVKLRYGAVHGAGHEISYDTCFARSSTVLVLHYRHITAEHIHGDLDVNVSAHGHVFVISSNHDRVQVRIQGDMESLAGAVVRAGAQLLLHKLKTGWSSETAEAAAEPLPDKRTQINRAEMKDLVKNLTFNKSFQLVGYTITLTPDHADDAFHVIFTRDRKKMCFLVLRYFTGHVRVSNISAADAHIRRRVELAHIPLEVTAFLRMVLRACLDLAAVAFDKYAREHG